MLIEVLYLLIVFVRKTEARSVWNVADGSTGLCYCVDDSCKVFIVRTACILSIELYVLNEFLRILHGCYGTLNDFLTVRVELVLDMRVRSADASMYALVLCIFKGLYGTVNILLNGTCKGAYCWPCHSL